MLSYKTHTIQPHPWGYELPITITTDDGEIHELLIRYDKPPSEAQIDKSTQEQIQRIEATVLEEPDELMFKSEVEALLRSKGYLRKDQKLEDLSPKDKKEVL